MKQKKSIIIYTFIISSILVFMSIDIVSASTFKEVINANVGHYPSTNLNINFQDVEISGNYVYISDSDLAGLRVLSLSDPTNPTLSASENLSKSLSYEIELGNDIAYIRSAENQDYDIEYFDISTPTSPVYKGLLELNQARGFDALGPTLFVCNGTDVISYNFTDINNPVELDRFNIGDYGQSLAIFNNYLYICTTGNILNIINATDPSSLSSVSSLDLGDFYAESYLVDGDILFISGLDSTENQQPDIVHRAHIKSIDISNKSEPSQLSDIFVDGINAVGLTLHNNKLFTGACAEGIKIVDITDPTTLNAYAYYDEYQEIYCGGKDYALYPKLYVDGTLGNLLLFVSKNCGFNIISIDNLEFEISIPGYDIFFLFLSTISSIYLGYRKFRKDLRFCGDCFASLAM
ncbi:MAG: LVIVD repeat-containing protein, partial [Candidatus Hermodarchaeota archaeon]